MPGIPVSLKLRASFLAAVFGLLPGGLVAGQIGFDISVPQSNFAEGEPIRVVVSVTRCFRLPPVLQVSDSPGARVVRIDIDDTCATNFVPAREYVLPPLAMGNYIVRLQVCEILPFPLAEVCAFEGSAVFTVGGGVPARPVPTVSVWGLAILAALVGLVTNAGGAQRTRSAAAAAPRQQPRDLHNPTIGLSVPPGDDMPCPSGGEDRQTTR